MYRCYECHYARRYNYNFQIGIYGRTNLTSVLYKGEMDHNADTMKTALEANGVTVGTDYWTN